MEYLYERLKKVMKLRNCADILKRNFSISNKYSHVAVFFNSTVYFKIKFTKFNFAEIEKVFVFLSTFYLNVVLRLVYIRRCLMV